MYRGTVVAFSGHASSIFDEMAKLSFINGGGLPKRTLQVIVTGADSGGHTGIQRELPDFFWVSEGFKSLYPLLDKEEFDVIPVGDLKSQIARWGRPIFGDQFTEKVDHNNYNKAAVTLFKIIFDDYRVQFNKANIGEVLAKHYLTNELYNEDRIRQKMQERFEAYLFHYNEAIKGYCAGNSERIEKLKHSIGNIILHFLYMECLQLIKFAENLESSSEFRKSELSVQDLFFGLLRNLNLVPQNLWLRILRERGLHLQAETETGENIISEGVIDDMSSDEKLKAESFKLYLDLNCQTEITKDEGINTIFENIVETTDFWIIPAGSVANWMPIINQFGDRIRASGKPIYMIVNAFEQINEPVLLDQIRQVAKVLGRFQLIIPENSPESVDGYKEYFETKYTEQRKKAVNFDNLQKLIMEENLDIQVHQILNWKSFSPGEGGLKYREDEIALFINLIGELLEKGNEINIREILLLHNIDKPSELLLQNIYTFIEKNKQFFEGEKPTDPNIELKII